MDAPSIPSASKLVAEIAQTKRLSKVVRSRACKPTKAIEKIAWAALSQADELAEGIRRLVRPTALCRGAGLLARTMWEGVVTLDYLRRRPRSRVRQLRVEGLLTLRAIKRSAWGQEIKEARLFGSQLRCIARARKREARYRRERRGGAKSGPFDLDQYAALPSMRERAHDVDAVDQYDFVYRLESIASAHWTFQSLFPSGGPGSRELQVLVLGVKGYLVLVSICADILGVRDDRLLSPVRREAASAKGSSALQKGN